MSWSLAEQAFEAAVRALRAVEAGLGGLGDGSGSARQRRAFDLLSRAAGELDKAARSGARDKEQIRERLRYLQKAMRHIINADGEITAHGYEPRQAQEVADAALISAAETLRRAALAYRRHKPQNATPSEVWLRERGLKNLGGDGEARPTASGASAGKGLSKSSKVRFEINQIRRGGGTPNARELAAKFELSEGRVRALIAEIKNPSKP